MLTNIKSFANYWIKYGPLFKERLKYVIDLQSLDHERLLEIQNQKFLKVFHHVTKASEFYKKLYAEYGVNTQAIQSIADIESLPVITKDMIRDQIDRVYTGKKWYRVKGHTSGTSGSPLVLYRTFSDVLNEAAYIWRHRSYIGYELGMKTVSLRGDLGREKMEQYDKFTNTLYLSSYNINEENSDWYYQKIKSFAPYAILAYPSSVAGLASLFSNLEKELHVPYIFTSSETLYSNQRTSVEEVFNTKILDWYGNAERTIAIEQRNDGRYYELPTYSHNEYREDHTVTTSLISCHFPLIRYKVTDIIKPCQYTGDQDKHRFQIAEISGRNDDVLLLPDGTKIGRLDVVLKGVKNVELAQFIQDSPYNFVLNLVVTNDFSSDDELKIIKNIEYRIGSNIQYDIKKVEKDDIIVSKSGKFKLVVNTSQSLNV